MNTIEEQTEVFKAMFLKSLVYDEYKTAYPAVKESEYLEKIEALIKRGAGFEEVMATLTIWASGLQFKRMREFAVVH